MRSFRTISINAFMELVRQPFFLVLMASSAAFITFLSSIYYFALGKDVKLVKDSALAIVFLSGLFGAVFSASSSVSREIQSGTALAVLSKPIGRFSFILAKFVGLAAALTLLTYVNMIASLVAGRISFDAYGEPNMPVLGIFFGSMGAAFIVGGFRNYFLKRPFVGDTVVALTVAFTLAFIFINFSGIQWGDGYGHDKQALDWRLVPATTLLLFALWILAALALACTTRLDMVATLGICSALFFLGLMSDFLFGVSAEQGSWIAKALYSITPNWQVFWMADALAEGKTIPWAYVLRGFEYMLGYLVMCLALALTLFQDRELS